MVVLKLYYQRISGITGQSLTILALLLAFTGCSHLS